MANTASTSTEVRLPQGMLIIGPPFSLGPPLLTWSPGLPASAASDPFWIAHSISQNPLAVWRLRGLWPYLGLSTPAYRLTDDAVAGLVGSAVAQGQLAARFIPWSAYTTCTLAVRQNRKQDLLPIIPTASRVDNRGRLLFQFTFDAHVADRFGSPAAGRALSLHTGNAADTITATPTDAQGNTTVVLQTRETGRVDIASNTVDMSVMLPTLDITEAWYESPFQITGYNVCDEADFSGAMAAGNGLAEQHREDFLFGARGVPMQGTGRALDGRLIRLSSMTGGWHRNAHGARDTVADRAQVRFAHTDGVHGAFATLQTDLSAAVDPHVIPPHARFEIVDVGARRADDRGSAIQDHHIDNYLGFGAAVVRTWLARGITNKDVKFLAYR